MFTKSKLALVAALAVVTISSPAFASAYDKADGIGAVVETTLVPNGHDAYASVRARKAERQIQSDSVVGRTFPGTW